MRRIESRLVGIVIGLLLSHPVWSKTDAECLKHLGGGYSDAECYAGLRHDLEAANQQLYSRIRASMPAGNVHLMQLDSYMHAQDNALKFCELQRDAGVDWQSNPDGSVYPALYEQCAYEMRTIEGKFLNDLLTLGRE